MKVSSDLADIALMVLVALLWAICFPFIVIGLPDAPPLLFAALRAFLAAGFLGCVCLLARNREPYQLNVRNVVQLGLIGLLYTAMGFGGMFLGAGKLSPGLATVLAGTQPLIAAVMAAVWLGEILKTQGILGLVTGFLGVALLAWPGYGENNAGYFWGMAWVVLAAVGTAAGNILLKKQAGGSIMIPMVVQLFIGGGVLLVTSAIAGEQWDVRWTLRFSGSLLILSGLATALMIVVWFGLLARSNLNRLNVYSFLTPVFGLFIGFLFFEETLTSVQVLGVLFIFCGIALLQRRDASVTQLIK